MREYYEIPEKYATKEEMNREMGSRLRAYFEYAVENNLSYHGCIHKDLEERAKKYYTYGGHFRFGEKYVEGISKKGTNDFIRIFNGSEYDGAIDDFTVVEKSLDHEERKDYPIADLTNALNYYRDYKLFHKFFDKLYKKKVRIDPEVLQHLKK
ncbi:5953_t:CDS:2 [Ambispora gerdemannii]|uniref:5953_t:CDS:1 n=1 Tax=Ambispora gerdemannii TaxID=144530 RepID=A0A9N8YN88_9GLOM|nr:5953_t:CDS:2 [Ambispora gerdemannii]